jgi:prepilin-type N-terminal cleavage/methylation domain-containing protein
MSISRRANNRGVTLFELMLGISILVIVSAGIYRIVEATVTAVQEVRTGHQRTQEIHGFFNVMRETFRSMPANASIEGVIDRFEGGAYPEIRLRGDPRAFAFGEGGVIYGRKTIATRPSPNGLLHLRLFIDEPNDADPALLENYVAPPSVLMVGDLQKVEWEFFDANQNQWRPTWQNRQVRPSLARLSLTAAGEDEPYVAEFHIPRRPPAQNQAQNQGQGGPRS